MMNIASICQLYSAVFATRVSNLDLDKLQQWEKDLFNPDKFVITHNKT